MPTWFWFASLGVILFFVWFDWWGRKPYVHRLVGLEDLPEFFAVLLERGEIGGCMFIRPDATRQAAVLPFIKYDSSASPGIRFAFPLSGEDAEALDLIVTAVRNGGFPVEDVLPPTDGPDARLVVNHGRDLKEAARLATRASAALGARTEVAEIWFENVGPGPIRNPKRLDGKLEGGSTV